MWLQKAEQSTWASITGNSYCKCPVFIHPYTYTSKEKTTTWIPFFTPLSNKVCFFLIQHKQNYLLISWLDSAALLMQLPANNTKYCSSTHYAPTVWKRYNHFKFTTCVLSDKTFCFSRHLLRGVFEKQHFHRSQKMVCSPACCTQREALYCTNTPV